MQSHMQSHTHACTCTHAPPPSTCSVMDGKKHVDRDEGLEQGEAEKTPENDEVVALFSRMGKIYMDEGGWMPGCPHSCAPAGPARAPAGPCIVQGSSRALHIPGLQQGIA